MSSPALTQGEARTLQSTWKDSNGDLVNPSVVVLEVLTPSGDVDTPAILNPSLGVFESVVGFDEVGDYYWEWTGTTTQGIKVCHGSVCVKPSWVDVPVSPGS